MQSCFMTTAAARERMVFEYNSTACNKAAVNSIYTEWQSIVTIHYIWYAIEKAKETSDKMKYSYGAACIMHLYYEDVRQCTTEAVPHRWCNSHGCTCMCGFSAVSSMIEWCMHSFDFCVLLAINATTSPIIIIYFTNNKFRISKRKQNRRARIQIWQWVQINKKSSIIKYTCLHNDRFIESHTQRSYHKLKLNCCMRLVNRLKIVP